MNNRPYLKWQCALCGEIYDEKNGSPAFGIEPGTRFEDIPDDWLCPSCGAAKSAFVILE